MQEHTTFIAFIAAILGLIAAILNLIHKNKQIRRENKLEKQRLKKNHDKQLHELALQQHQEEVKAEVLETSLRILTRYIDETLTESLSKFTTKSQLDTLDQDLKKYIKRELKTFIQEHPGVSAEQLKSIEKTLGESFGIDMANYTMETSGIFGNFFTDRVERRIAQYNKAQKK
ncbi:MAG: hypothetical protein CL868_18930 [Cytophagaceae bacterium]|nr:hypothetical protein [Cytophagaceae bacterium]|tara:strand:+ start:226 stop:744 length:519 start_codon:yes stop_codon:yes gene_type:complete